MDLLFPALGTLDSVLGICPQVQSEEAELLSTATPCHHPPETCNFTSFRGEVAKFSMAGFWGWAAFMTESLTYGSFLPPLNDGQGLNCL